MTASWVAASVRARGMARRRYGAAAARALAGSATLTEALSTLVDTPYGHDVRGDHSLAQAQHALGATVLWHLRVLAGWTPRQGARTLRAIAAGFEIANVDEHLRALRGHPTPPPYRLGTRVSWNVKPGCCQASRIAIRSPRRAW